MKFCWSTLRVNNLEESLDFYQKIVGLKSNRRFKTDENTEIAFLGNGETKLELIDNNENNDVNYGEDISLGFEVDSLEDKMNHLKENSIDIESGPIQPNPNIKFFFVKDPNGLTIQFVENINN
jgi:lactoylglutathione lyase